MSGRLAQLFLWRGPSVRLSVTLMHPAKVVGRNQMPLRREIRKVETTSQNLHYIGLIQARQEPQRGPGETFSRAPKHFHGPQTSRGPG